jgi:hypothetical protein
MLGVGVPGQIVDLLGLLLADVVDHCHLSSSGNRPFEMRSSARSAAGHAPPMRARCMKNASIASMRLARNGAASATLTLAGHSHPLACLLALTVFPSSFVESVTNCSVPSASLRLY